MWCFQVADNHYCPEMPGRSDSWKSQAVVLCSHFIVSTLRYLGRKHNMRGTSYSGLDWRIVSTVSDRFCRKCCIKAGKFNANSFPPKYWWMACFLLTPQWVRNCLGDFFPTKECWCNSAILMFIGVKTTLTGFFFYNLIWLSNKTLLKAFNSLIQFIESIEPIESVFSRSVTVSAQREKTGLA